MKRLNTTDKKKKVRNLLVVHAHWNNRGDEAATRAMMDEIVERYPGCTIKVLVLSNPVEQFPATENISYENLRYPRNRDLYFECPLVLFSKGALATTERSKQFLKLVREADLVIHAPGGPSIGDIYIKDEMHYLFRLLLVRMTGTPYAFFAPSMGPFDTNRHRLRNRIRRKVLNGASIFCLREPVSKKYVERLGGVKEPVVTLDSAFQHRIDRQQCQVVFDQYTELKTFLESHKKVVGITITDLMWNPKYKGEPAVKETIARTFHQFIKYLSEVGYGILFIPQLFGLQQDKAYMESFCTENCFVMSDQYDCYFQQYVISKMYALIGMRYHSNIFSAKMGCPFISVSYEQKMSGFMKKMNLDKYCIAVEALSFEKLRSSFMDMVNDYDRYKQYLQKESEHLREEAAKTTDMVLEFLNTEKGV